MMLMPLVWPGRRLGDVITFDGNGDGSPSEHERIHSRISGAVADDKAGK